MANVETTGVVGTPHKRTLVASAAAMKRGLAVVLVTDDNHVAIAGANVAAFGIIEEDTISIGDPVSVVLAGEAVAQIGAAVSAGQLLVTDANGRLIPATSGAVQNAVAKAISSGSTSGDFIVVLVSQFSSALQNAITHYVAAGAIPVAPGTAGLGSGAALAMTLAAPASPADDGKTIFVVAETAHAHTVTTPANAINGNKHIVTFAAQGDGVVLEAISGVWYVRAAISGAVLS